MSSLGILSMTGCTDWRRSPLHHCCVAEGRGPETGGGDNPPFLSLCSLLYSSLPRIRVEEIASLRLPFEVSRWGGSNT